MTDHDTQAEHRALLTEVASDVTNATARYVKDKHPTLMPMDTAAALMIAGATIANKVTSAAMTAAMLRKLADDVEAGAPLAN